MTWKATGLGRAFTYGTVAVGLLVGMPVLRAQQAPVSGTPGAPAPPAIQFPAQGISLDEAIRLALEHGPFIQRREAEADFAAGVAQQQSGIFDTTLRGSAVFTHRVQELTESRKEEEQKKRDDLQTVVDQGPANIANAQAARDLIVGIQNGTATAADLAPVSPTLSATLQTLDAQIAASSPPLRNQLIAIRNDVLAQAAETANAQLQSAQTIFTEAQQGLMDLGPAPDDEYFRDLNTNVELSKLLRNGISFAPFFSSEYSSTNFVGKPREAQFGGKGLDDLYTFRAGIGAMLPLARGRGAAAIAAGERAARLEHEAALLSLDHERATTALETIRAYWQLRAAQDTLAIAAQSLTFQEQLVNAVQGRIDAGVMAGVELTRAQGAQARARADRDEAARRLTEARVQLAVAMGIAATDDDTTLPRAADAFPGAAVASPAVELVAQALAERPDLTAAAQVEDAGRVLVEGARLDTRSRLDLSVAAWYTALDEGTVAGAMDRWVGPSGSAELQFEKPFGNNGRLGALAQREADLRRRGIDQRDLARRIQLNVLQSSGTLAEAGTRVQQARAAVDFYQQTIDAEFQRLQDGDSTVIDTILTQQQQIGAQLALVAAELDLALRQAELRYQTGTLVREAGGTPGVAAPEGGRR